jgi:RNA polymerase sigma-70 factor (ECF subfamily)
LGLYAICYRVASDRRRRAYERREVVQAAPNVAEVADPAPPIEFDRRRALLQAALSTLPLEQRAVFTLFELEGLRGDEIAAMLGIPVPTVHSRLRLAREGFRRALLRAAAQDQARLRRTGVIP